MQTNGGERTSSVSSGHSEVSDFGVQCPVPIGLDLAAPTQLIPRRRRRLAPLAHDFRLSFPLTGCFAILFFFF